MKPSEFARSRTSGEVCRVLVSLRDDATGDAVLARLRTAGLAIEKVVEGTIVGSIATDAIPALESDESVAAVERSEQLDADV